MKLVVRHYTDLDHISDSHSLDTFAGGGITLLGREQRFEILPPQYLGEPIWLLYRYLGHS